MATYSKDFFLHARAFTPLDRESKSLMCTVEAVPEQEAGRQRKERPKPATKPIGPIIECIPVDAAVLKAKRDQLRRIERDTGAMISEKPGLGGRCTVMIQGTQSIVEKAFPVVEALIAEAVQSLQSPVGEGRLPENRKEGPPPEPPPKQPTPAQNVADSIEEGWEIPDHWARDEKQADSWTYSGDTTERWNWNTNSWSRRGFDVEDGDGFWEGEYEPGPSQPLHGTSASSTCHRRKEDTHQNDGKGDAKDLQSSYDQSSWWGMENSESHASWKFREEPVPKDDEGDDGWWDGDNWDMGSPAETDAQIPDTCRMSDDVHEPPPVVFENRVEVEQVVAEAPKGRWRSRAGNQDAQKDEETEPSVPTPLHQRPPPPPIVQLPAMDLVNDDAMDGAAYPMQPSGAFTSSRHAPPSIPPPPPAPSMPEVPKTSFPGEASDGDEEKSITDEEERAAVSSDIDGMWDDDPAATWQGTSSSLSKAPPVMEEKCPVPLQVSQSVKSKGPPPQPPKEKSVAVPKPPPKAPTVEVTPSVKAKPPPPAFAKDVVVPAAPSKPAPPEPKKEVSLSPQPETDSDEDEDATSSKRKKKKKKKKKEANKQSGDAPVEEPTPVVREAPRAKADAIPKQMQHLHSKTAFSGLVGGSDSEEEVIVAPPPPKEKAKATSAKARPAEKKKETVTVVEAKTPVEAPKAKAVVETPKAKQKGVSFAQLVKPPPPGISAKPAPAGVPPPQQSEAVPKVTRPSPPPPPARSSEPKPPPPRPTPPPVPSSSSSAPARPPYEKDAEIAKKLQEELNKEEDFFAGLTRLPTKNTASASTSASPKAKAASAKTVAKPKPKAPVQAKGLNPLPQKAMLKPAPSQAIYIENAASGAKWAERPVEKIYPGSTHYEEEEDPELACYLWDRKAQRPKREQARPSAPPSMDSAPPLSAARVSAPAPQKQRALLSKVMEMGFDEQSARRALTDTGWAGVEEALMRLLG